VRGIKTRYQSYKNYDYTILEEIKCTNLESAQLESKFKQSTQLEKYEFPPGETFQGHTECYQNQG